MAKEVFYFSHDYNSRNDRKMQKLSMKHGMVGIGVYWCIIEMLYEEGGFLPKEYERMAFELRINTDVVRSVIEDFELFMQEEERFWSESVIRRLQERCDKSEKARKSIMSRWARYERNTNE
jgi:hypothetical protein